MHPQYSPEFIARFWARVDKTSSPFGCWLWTGNMAMNGYGYVYYRYGKLLAHRVAYELLYGSIPDGLFVCHHCDNPPCVRPDHLFVGTQKDNMADKAAKKRGWGNPLGPTVAPERRPRGERNFQARVTPDIVREIRRAFDAHEATTRELGRRFGISQCAAWQIARRRVWKHIPD